MIISKCRIIDTDLYWQSPKRQQFLWILTKTQWNSVFLRIEQKYNEIQFFLCILTNKNTMRFSVLWKNDFSMKFIACNGGKYIVIYTDRVAECSRSARCNFRMQHAATIFAILLSHWIYCNWRHLFNGAIVGFGRDISNKS